MEDSNALTKVKSYLQSLSEAKLQNEIVIPLLETQGYFNVRDKSGATDCGQDVIAQYKIPRRTILYAIQIKKQKYHAKYNKSKSLHQLFGQLNQAEKREIPLLDSGQKKKPDELIFITPYDFSQASFELVQEIYLEKIQKNWSIMDGTILAQEVLEYIPEKLETLLNEDYRTSQIIISNIIDESASAFKLPKPLKLNEIYVEVSVMHTLREVTEVLKADAKKYGQANLSTPKSSLNVFKKISSKLNIDIQDSFECYPDNIQEYLLSGKKPSKGVIELDKELKKRQYRKYEGSTIVPDSQRIELDKRRGKYNKTNYSEHKILTVDYEKIISIFRKIGEKSLHNLKKQLARKNSNTEAILKELIFLKSIGECYYELKFSQIFKNKKEVFLTNKKITFPQVSPENLSKIRHTLFVIGPPGVGKTTLMRRLTQITAKNSSLAPPIFYQLAYLEKPTVENLFLKLSEQLGKGIEEVKSDILSGKYSLYLDGLDELGPEATTFLEHVNEHLLNDKTKITISCRNTVGINWDNAIAVEVPKFNNSQVIDFINNWEFKNTEDVKKLTTLVESNRNLSEIIRTPLFTALICSIFDVGKAIPETELELYDSRLDLLLGGWEKSKGIKRLRTSDTKLTYNFLCVFAASLHKDRVQNFKLETLRMFLRGNFSSSDVDIIVSDLLSRSLIQPYSDDSYWFGHLTYQEHLVAKYYFDNCDYDEIIEKIGNRFYHKVWDMYCDMVPSLDPLFKYIVKHQVNLSSLALFKLEDMLLINKLTSRSLAYKVLKSERILSKAPLL